MRISTFSRFSLVLALSAVLVLSFGYITSAQEQESDAELRATIRASIMSDPRTAELTEAEIEEMVDALSGEAAAQGVTSEDIVWRPEEPAPAPIPSACGSLPAFLCALNEALGFDGSDIRIPIGLGVTSALLLFVIGSILLHRHGHHPVQGAVGIPSRPSASSETASPEVPIFPPPSQPPSLYS